jgi:DNA-binding winged helix-turn-helix (wHTH) protein
MKQGEAAAVRLRLKSRLIEMRQAFGDCIFDRDRRELTRGGTVVHSGPKLLALLEVLLDAAPRAVTKDEIHKAIWPDTFVADATLTSLVAELRAAIGDEAKPPRLVRTIHGYGYAFVGEITNSQAFVSRSNESQSFRIIVGDREVALSRGAYILGRSPDAGIFVDDGGVSRHHARITIGADGAILEDLASKNGTILDGEPVGPPRPLVDGSLIVIGATALKFRVFAALSSTDTVAHKR